MEGYNLPFNPEEVLNSFRPVNELFDQLDDQAVREQEIDARITDPELRDKTHEGLADERQLTVEKFRHLPGNPFDELLGLADVALDDKLTQAAGELEAARERMSEEQRSYDDQLQWSIKLAPLSQRFAEELVERKKNEIELRETAEARERLERLEAARVELDNLFEAAGRAWPLSYSGNSGKTTEIVYEDELPVEPGNRSCAGSPGRTREHLTERDNEIRQKIVKYMVGRSGETITVEDLIQELLPDEVIAILDRRSQEMTGYYARSRFTTLLGHNHEKTMQDLFADEGHFMQYGWRKTKEVDRQTGQQLGQVIRYRIYRVLPFDTYDPSKISQGEQVTVPSNGRYLQHSDVWENVDNLSSFVGEQAEGSVDYVIGTPEKEDEAKTGAPEKKDFSSRLEDVIWSLCVAGLIKPEAVTLKRVQEILSERNISNKNIRLLMKVGLLERTSRSNFSRIILSAKQIVALRLLASRDKNRILNSDCRDETMAQIEEATNFYLSESDESERVA